MGTSRIVAGIDEEIARLQQVRSLLSGGGSGADNGRRAAKKRVLSAEARAKISAAQKKRWAKQKRAAAKQAVKAPARASKKASAKKAAAKTAKPVESSTAEKKGE